MKKCAVILNGKDIVKVTNLPRKYNKFINNPEIKILEECDTDEINERFKYWCENPPVIKIEKEVNDWEKPKLYHWKNIVTGYTFHSIYNRLLSHHNPNEWIPYEQD